MTKFEPTFSAQPVRADDEVQGYLVSGFLSTEQLTKFRAFIDEDGYDKSKRWRGEYQQIAKALITAIDGAETN